MFLFSAIKVGGNEGKKSGHKGKTRAKDKPNKIVWVKADKNPPQEIQISEKFRK